MRPSPSPTARRATPPYLLPDVAPRTPIARPGAPRRSPRSGAPRTTGPRPYLDPSLPHDKNFQWTTEAQTVEELEMRARMGDLTMIAHAKKRFGRDAARRVASAAGYSTDVDWAMLGL